MGFLGWISLSVSDLTFPVICYGQVSVPLLSSVDGRSPPSLNQHTPSPSILQALLLAFGLNSIIYKEANSETDRLLN